jgi:hypothetical protein
VTKLRYERQIRSQDNTNENPLALDCLGPDDCIGIACDGKTDQHSASLYASFKWLDQAVKATRENPQDRSAQAAKLHESLGGKMENIYFFPSGGEYDRMIIA